MYNQISLWARARVCQFNFICTVANTFKIQLLRVIKSCFSKLGKFKTQENVFAQTKHKQTQLLGNLDVSDGSRTHTHTQIERFKQIHHFPPLTLAVIDCLEWRHFGLSTLVSGIFSFGTNYPYNGSPISLPEGKSGSELDVKWVPSCFGALSERVLQVLKGSLNRSFRGIDPLGSSSQLSLLPINSD